MNEPTEIELKYLVKNNFDLSDLILYLRSNGFNATSIKFVMKIITLIPQTKIY